MVLILRGLGILQLTLKYNIDNQAIIKLSNFLR